MLKLLKNKLVTLVSVGLFLFAQGVFASIVVIGNSHSKIHSLTKKELRILYLNRPAHLSVSLVPYDHSHHSSLYVEFHHALFGWSAEEARDYWLPSVFSGKKYPPAQISSEAAAVAVVKKNSHAVAYISSKFMQKHQPNVRVLYVFGTYQKKQIASSAKIPISPKATLPASHKRSILRGLLKKLSVVRGKKESSKKVIKKKPVVKSKKTVMKPKKVAIKSKKAVVKSKKLVVKPKKAVTIAKPKLIMRSQMPVLKIASVKLPKLIIKASKPTRITQVPQIKMPVIHQNSSLIWGALHSHFKLGQYVNQPSVQYSIKWFLNHRSLLNKILENSRPYLYYVYQQTQKRHMPAELALIPMIESGYDPFAYSARGATGIWQMMPTTAASFGLKMNWWYDARRDTIASTQYALNYFKQLHKTFRDWLLAIAAYDAGQGTIEQAIQYNQKIGKSMDFWSLPLPYETKSYVPKLLALAAIISNPDRYHVKLPAIYDTPYFSVISGSSQITLTQAAHLSGVKESTIQKLNPGLRRWATKPDATYNLLVPKDKAKIFKKHIKALLGHEQVTWNYHEVRTGDTLKSIAGNYHTTMNVLQKANGLKAGETVSEGQGILVPLWLHQKFGEKANQTVHIALPNNAAAQRLRQNSMQKNASNNLGQQIRKDDSLKTILSKLYPSQS